MERCFSEGKKSAHGYGSYRLRILVDKNESSLMVSSSGVRTSSEIYINGELLGNSGSPSANKEDYVARVLPNSVSFTTDKTEIEIVIHVANYSISHTGGIFKSILFGNEKALTHQRIVSIGLQLLLCVVLLLHAVYAAILYTIGPRQKMLIYFFLLVISAITTVLIDDDKLLLHMLPLNYQWSLKLLIISNIMAFIFILLTSKQLMFQNFKNLKCSDQSQLRESNIQLQLRE